MGVVRHNHNVTYQCHYHLVWCPKYRRRVLTSLDPRLNCPPHPKDPGPIDQRLTELIFQVCDERSCDVLAIEVMPDHVHLLVDCDPQFGIHRLARLIKGRTSHHLRAEYPSLKQRLPTLWTNSYFVATTGGAPLTLIKQYIQNQPKT